MTDFLIVLALATLPAAGNFAGGMWAEWRPPSPRGLNVALHIAAGIVLAVVAVEVMPRALDVLSGWLVGAAFVIGGAAYVTMDELVSHVQSRSTEARDSRVWMIYLAVATDLFADGLLIGAGTAVNPELGLLLALAQVLADVPEGYAVVANMRDKGMPRRQRVLLSVSFAAPVLLAATLAYVLLRGQADSWKLIVLVIAAGLLIVAAVEDMMNEAHESHQDTRRSLAGFIGGFALFTFVSAGLGH